MWLVPFVCFSSIFLCLPLTFIDVSFIDLLDLRLSNFLSSTWSDMLHMIFTPRSLLRMGYCRHCTRRSVGTYVRPKFFLRFLVFWDPHVGSSWRFFHFWKKMIFWACHALFLTIFLIYKGLLGARCKSGDLCWKGFVFRFWIYIVVRPDFFQKELPLALQIMLKIGD